MKSIAFLAAALIAAAPLAAQDVTPPADTAKKPAAMPNDSVRQSTLGGQVRNMPTDSVKADSAKQEKLVEMADTAAAMADSLKQVTDSMKKVADPDMAVKGSKQLPTGWMGDTDGDAAITEVHFTPSAGGWHVATGPAAILWKNDNRVTGDFHAVASFTQNKAPRHPEAYGMFFGGDALNGEGQKYTYFLVRGDGQFLIKERKGAEATNVTSGWAAHTAIAKADAEGKAVNKLEVEAAGETVTFKVNGQQVHQMNATPDQINGIVGLRVNHNLDVNVNGFAVHDN